MIEKNAFHFPMVLLTCPTWCVCIIRLLAHHKFNSSDTNKPTHLWRLLILPHHQRINSNRLNMSGKISTDWLYLLNFKGRKV